MAAVEARHWWYRTLHNLVLQAIADHPAGRAARILDAGCGTGGLLQTLGQAGYRSAQGFDLSLVAVSICNKHGLAVCQGDLADITSIYAGQTFDVIVSNDTLYHLPETARTTFLRQAHDRLTPGGLLIMNLPALSMFRGQHDRAVGVTHRFSREELKQLLQGTGFQTITSRYWPATLAPLIGLIRGWQRLTDRTDQTTRPKSDLKAEEGLLDRWINALLYKLVALEIRCIRSGPAASSLMTVLRRS